jgi:hypothetical protein
VGLFVLKYVLMTIGLLAYRAAASRILGDNRLALLATCALLAAYVPGVQAHFVLSHSILLSACLSILLLCIMRVLDRGDLTDYVLLGISMGVGLWSKYVFGVTIAAFAIAAFFTSGLRTRLSGRRLLLACAIAIALFLPAVLSVLIADFSIFGALSQKVNAGAAMTLYEAWAVGIWNYGIAVAGFLLPAAAIFLMAWPYRQGEAQEPAAARDHDMRRFLSLSILFSAAMLGAPIIFLRATLMWAHWMYPVLFTAPILAVLTMKIRNASAARLQLVASAVMILVVAIVGGRIWLWGWGVDYCGACRSYWPMAKLAQDVRTAGRSPGALLTDDYVTAANLMRFLPGTQVYVAPYPAWIFGPTGSGKGCLIVWTGMAAMTPRLREALLVRGANHATDGIPVRHAVELLRGSAWRTAELSYLTLPDLHVCDNFQRRLPL